MSINLIIGLVGGFFLGVAVVWYILGRIFFPNRDNF